MEQRQLHEQTFNVELGRALRRSNARWRENPSHVAIESTRSDGKRPDILIDDGFTPKVAIECAYGGDRDRDAKARLDIDGIDTAIAVSIPPKFKNMSDGDAAEALAHGAKLGYAVVQDNWRFPSVGHIRGTVADLAAIVPVASVTGARVKTLADGVAESVNAAAAALEAHMSKDDCKSIVAAVHQRSALTGFRTVCVLWLDALLVQSHLRSQGRKVGDTPLPKEVAPSKLAADWRTILDTNWHSIFAPAVDVLERAARKSRRATVNALRLLLRAAEDIESARIGDHVNIAAELFPKISEDRKTAAAFYTTSATAQLLAALTIRGSDAHEWRDPSVFRRLKVADLACGTGTLLRAAYRRVRTLHELAGGSMRSVGQLHKDAMERGIVGADVSPIASHLTNSSMAVMGRGDPYGKTHIGWVSVGVPVAGAKRSRTSGSLEFLKAQDVEDLFDDLGGAAGGQGGESNPIVVGDECLDYALMNPPYSRTRGGQSSFDVAGLSDDERKECQRRWESLLSGQPALKTAGMAASFLCLARKKVKPSGRIGVVLPLSAAFSQSWEPTRKMVVDEFGEVVAVAKAGASAGGDALSADTGMGEMLLVATKRERRRGRRNGGPSRGVVHCVTLRRVPTREGEAGEFGRSILAALGSRSSASRPVVAGGDELGNLAVYRHDAGDAWMPLGALHSDVVDAAVLVLGGAMPGLKVGMTTIDELFDVGPTHDLIGHPKGGDGRGAFEFHPIARKADLRGSNRALWKADAEKQRRLVVEPTHKGVPLDSGKARRLRNRQGTLHYARGMRWTSQSLLAASTKRAVFGGRAWITLRHKDERVLKAFALWGNSTLGLLTHWTRGERTQLGRSPTQVKAVQAMPCPSLAQLPAGALDKAAAAFDALSARELKPACQAHADDARAKIDDAALAMLGLKQDAAGIPLSDLRGLWCAEPTVHGNNQAAVALLRENNLLD